MKAGSKLSIAVLPLVNRSSNPEDEYISDGMTEELILSLSKIPGLKVSALTSSFSFKEKALDIRDIGTQLGVDNLLEGSIRKSGNQLRVNLQLINVEDGFCLWADRFKRDISDIFALQDEISLVVADRIRENFGHLEFSDNLVNKSTSSISAYEHYLKGRHKMREWTAENLETAIAHQKQAIAEDPSFAKAYFEIAWSYIMLIAWGYIDPEETIELVHSYARRGKSLVQESAEYYYLMATEAFWLQWDFKKSRAFLLQALALDPENSTMLESMAELCLPSGHFEEGLQYINQSLEIDPLSPNHWFTKAHLLNFKGEQEEALKLYDYCLELNPKFSLAWGHKIQILLQLQRKAELENCLEHCDAPEKVEELYLRMHGSPVEKEKLSLPASDAESSLFPWNLYLWAHSDHLKEATAYLQKMIHQKAGTCINYRFDPLLKPLKEYPSAQALFELESWDSIQNRKVQAHAEEKPDFQFLKQLEELIQAEELYLNPKLSLRELAETLNCSPNYLSWQINKGLGQNFNEYVNGFRLKRFQHIALLPENKTLTLLALAFDSGFNTKSVFNEYFKKQTGLSPRAWLKARQLP